MFAVSFPSRVWLDDVKENGYDCQLMKNPAGNREMFKRKLASVPQKWPCGSQFGRPCSIPEGLAGLDYLI